jgi:hypothetical protein
VKTIPFVLFWVIALLGAAGLRVMAAEDPCSAALATEGVRWDGPEMEQFTWGGFSYQLDPIDGMTVSVCVADGPAELLPITQAIGCLLIREEVAHIDGDLACGAFQALDRVHASGLYWVAHDSAATSFITPLNWEGDGFYSTTGFLVCADSHTPVPSALACRR